MQAAANFLIDSKHVGKPQNGLLSPFPGPNGMGQYYMGFTPENTQAIIDNPPSVLIVAQADVLADDPDAAAWLGKAETVINLTLFDDELGNHASMALPVQSFAERDGSYTNGERRVQRFYTAQGPVGEALPAWQVVSRIGEALGQGPAKLSAAVVMLEITKSISAFAGCRYKELAWTEQQYPMIGDDLWYGGTAYKNQGGLGVQIAAAADEGAVKAGKVDVPDAAKAGRGKLIIVPVVSLYNRERMFRTSDVVDPRVPAAFASLNSDDAKRLKVDAGDYVEIEVDNGPAVQVQVRVDDGVPKGSVLLPRHLTTTAMPLAPAAGKISKVNVPEVSKV
jgi:NADH-quinone oxidoreductase subunit G